MSLRIVEASEPIEVKNIVLTIYSQPGLWKTSIAQTSHEPITLDFDKGIYRAFNRRASVPITTWEDVEKMNADDLKRFSTVVIDTAGRALDILGQDIISNNPKAGRSDGSLSLQGFGTLKSRFAQWQSFLRSQGKDIILICHMDEQRNGDDTLERIDAQGGSKNEIYKSSDAMCRIRLDSRDSRYLDFDPRQGGFGKNPAQLGKIPVPSLKDNPTFLADVITQIKGSINKLTVNQADAAKAQNEWASLILECTDVPSFNATILPRMKEDKAFKVYAAKVARDRGYKANRTTGLYEPAEVKA